MMNEGKITPHQSKELITMFSEINQDIDSIKNGFIVKFETEIVSHVGNTGNKEDEAHFLKTKCPYNVSGGFQTIKVGSEYCEDCEYFIDIDFDSRIVQCCNPNNK